MPLLVHHLRRRQAMALPDPAGAATLRPGQMILADPVAPVPVDPAAQADLKVVPVDPAAQADLKVVPAGPVAPAALGNTARAAQVDLKVVPAGPVARAGRDIPAALVSMVRADLVVPAGRVARADPVVPAGRGTEIRTAATSTTRRGATDLALGDRVSRLVRRGIDRSRRLAVRGTMARSTTGATRKPPCGIPVSTPGASGSSGCGSRCKSLTSTHHDARFAARRGGRRALLCGLGRRGWPQRLTLLA
ncbi:hypothetical protein H7K44_23860 [Mycobacterium florentinum]|nr:hypothetical protein [Mycobacterium florentinum]BBX82021.1 hypothetical protein MFLOJ_58080 [Mycobacterium florentinum]